MRNECGTSFPPSWCVRWRLLKCEARLGFQTVSRTDDFRQRSGCSGFVGSSAECRKTFFHGIEPAWKRSRRPRALEYKIEIAIARQKLRHACADCVEQCLNLRKHVSAGLRSCRFVCR